MSRLDASFERMRRCDEWLCLRMNAGLRYGALLHFFRAVSWLGNGIFWYALMLALLVQHRGEALLPVLHMIFVGAVGSATYAMVKRGTSRRRPFEVVPAVAAGAAPLDAFSFPSGHTLHAVAFTLVALRYYPSLAAILVAFAVLTAASRVVLGLHYPSDVLAGERAFDQAQLRLHQRHIAIEAVGGIAIEQRHRAAAEPRQPRGAQSPVGAREQRDGAPRTCSSMANSAMACVTWRTRAMRASCSGTN